MIFVRPPHEVKERTRAMRLDFLRRYDRDELREQLYLEQKGICAICGKPMQDSSSVVCEIGHATPVNVIANWDWDIEKASEVANSRKNLLLLHMRCNRAQLDCDFEDFYAVMRRDDNKFGETPKLTAKQIVALKLKLSERNRKAAIKAGRKNIETGHFDRIRNLPQSKEAYRRNGVAVGHSQSHEDCVRNGRKKFELYGNSATPSDCAKGGRIGAHVLWHVRRDIVNRSCALCQQAAA